jgi:uncharacterized protein (TIGR04255 family)
MPSDFLYENPPLVEVIAEIRWKLQPIQSLPNAAIDPHFSTLVSELTSVLDAEAYRVIESLVPAEVPIELVANRVVKRFRRGADLWPVFQVGPGVFTVNVVPPYNGWREFREILSYGVDLLFKSYPLPEKYLSLREVSLKYIDAFSAKHGYNDLLSFLRDYVNFSVAIPDEILDSAKDPKSVSLATTARFPLKERQSSSGTIKIGSGKHQDSDAAILELVAQDSDCASSPEAILDWMDFGHVMVRQWFQLLTNDKLKQLMGPMRGTGA